MIYLLVLLAVVMLPVWTVIHETAHLAAIAKLRLLLTWWMYPYPHVHEKRFYVGRLKWLPSRQVLPRERAWIAIAPRIVDGVAIGALQFSMLFHGWAFWVWVIVWGAGLVDFATRLIGISKYSDLQNTARGFDIPPWALRTVGVLLIAASVGTVVTAYFVGGQV